MRKGINGLSILIADELSYNPSDGRVYIFYNKSYNKLKMLYWDRNGFCLHYKILEGDKFKIPNLVALRMLSPEQLRWLFDGLDIDKVTGFKSIKYEAHF